MVGRDIAMNRFRFPYLRSGMSIIEVMVSISIVSLLMSLLVPAVSSARHAARNAVCTNNLRQIGSAFLTFESTRKHLPTNGGYTDASKIKPKDGGVMIAISSKDVGVDNLQKWGIGAPVTDSRKQPGSWGYALLPYLDQSIGYNSVDVETPLSIYSCSARARLPVGATIDDQFGEYVSGGWSWSKSDYCANSKISKNLPYFSRLMDIKRGAANVVLLGEKAYDPDVQTSTSWYWDEPIFSGGSKGTARSGFLIFNDARGIEFRDNWGSAHPGLCNFVKADGSVQAIDRTIDRQVFISLITPEVPRNPSTN